MHLGEYVSLIKKFSFHILLADIRYELDITEIDILISKIHIINLDISRPSCIESSIFDTLNYS